MEKKSLFSQEALDKLRSPEKLDTLLHVTNPLGWMALISIMLMLVGVVIWSIMGSFTNKTDGIGMLMDSGGIVTVNNTSGGRIESVVVHQGQKISKGALVAIMEQPAQKAETQLAENNMALAKNSTDASSRAADFDAKNYQKNINTNIYSNYDGIVEEIPVKEGNVINAGDTVCTLRRIGDRNDLNGVLYVPIDQSKKIQPGMTVQLAPSGADSSKDGSLIGIVRNVSDYPVSSANIQRNLANDIMAQQINQTLKQAAVEVRFDLVKDDENESGYLWTSVVGEHRPITPGTYVTGSIIIDRQPPIKKVFYKISQWLRSR